jgi:acyl-CoA thioesterase FadM
MKHFQQIARENLDEFGMSYSFLRDHNIVFVLTKYKFKFHGQLNCDETYVFKTAPCQVQGVSFIRDFLIEDKNGKIVAEASSTWIIIDYINRSILRPNKLPKEIPHCDKLVDFIPERIRTNVLEGDLLESKMTDYKFKVSYTSLDQNNHLNNCNYADILIDGLFENNIELPDSYEIEMSFDHEAKVFSELCVHFEKSDSIIAICKNLTDDSTCFTAEVKY